MGGGGGWGGGGGLACHGGRVREMEENSDREAETAADVDA